MLVLGRRGGLKKHHVRRVQSGSGSRSEAGAPGGKRGGMAWLAALGIERKRQTGTF